MHTFLTGTLEGLRVLPGDVIDQMYRLRYEIFHERLNWEVRVELGREMDEFDDRDTTYVVGVDGQTGRVDAAWRLRPTDTPYMLRDTFPYLLQGRQAPRQRNIWEVSRFAVVNTPYADTGVGSFGALTRDLVAHTIHFALRGGIGSFVWVTSLGVERMARRLGYRLDRWGRPMMIGKVNCVVNEIVVDDHAVALADDQLGYSQQLLEAA